MKVALVIRKFAPAGGAERACANLARGLMARGHEVHVFAREIAPLEGIRPHPTPREGASVRSSFGAKARRLLQEESFDIIHSFTRTFHQDILRLGGGIHKEYLAQTDKAYSWAGRLWRKLRPKERVELRLEEMGLMPGASRLVVAVSKRVKDEAVRHYKVDEERIRVIYNGVDGERFKPDPGARAQTREQIGFGRDDYVLLFCGTGFRRKGLAYAVAAVDRVPSARLLVAGEGSPLPHPRVTYLGRQSDVAPLYAAADALILPTLYDPFPNVCLEAMAAGIPIIVSRVAGPSEIVDGDSLVVEDPTNVDTLAEAVRRLEDPPTRKSMGEAARKKALEFTLDRTLEANLGVYGEILEQKRREGKVEGGARR